MIVHRKKDYSYSYKSNFLKNSGNLPFRIYFQKLSHLMITDHHAVLLVLLPFQHLPLKQSNGFLEGLSPLLIHRIQNLIWDTNQDPFVLQQALSFELPSHRNESPHPNDFEDCLRTFYVGHFLVSCFSEG